MKMLTQIVFCVFTSNGSSGVKRAPLSWVSQILLTGKDRNIPGQFQRLQHHSKIRLRFEFYNGVADPDVSYVTPVGLQWPKPR